MRVISFQGCRSAPLIKGGKILSGDFGNLFGRWLHWNEMQAAYRFFSNKRTNAESVLKPHQDAVLKRIEEQPVVLLVQDTTEIDVTRRHEEMKGAGPLSEANRLGFFNHVMLAITPDRVPLGVVQAQIFARDMEEFLRNQKDKKNKS